MQAQPLVPRWAAMTEPSFPAAVAPLTTDERVRAIDGVAASHRRLIGELARLTDDQARSPSVLDGWSVGHVLTHIARNADSFRGIADGVLAGEERDQYPGGAAQRTGDIETGAVRPAAELVADVREAAERLEATWAQLSDEQWASGTGRTAAWGAIPISYVVLARWREVEIHRTDLGLGATWHDLDPAYLRAEVPRALAILAGLAGADDGADPALARVLVATLFGRREGPVDVPAVL